MTSIEKVKELYDTGLFWDDEIKVNGQYYSSIEYYLIVVYSNEELYYLSDEEEETLTSSSDLIIDIDKARMYLIK